MAFPVYSWFGSERGARFSFERELGLNIDNFGSDFTTPGRGSRTRTVTASATRTSQAREVPMRIAQTTNQE